jgi:uncharacterized protein (DUF1697 family)
MTRYVALLRAVNVGGTGKLPMGELKAMCLDAGFISVETYIASGNVVLDSKAKPQAVKAELEARLLAYFGKPARVVVRTAEEMAAVLKANPFPGSEERAIGQTVERMALGHREIFVHYGDGMGRSKLRIPAAKAGTARNMNTVAKLAEIASRP